jgi:osmoprotectant transport system permease protein
MNDFIQGFHFIFDHNDLIWTKTVEHIELSAKAILISVLIAVPIGVFLGHIHRFSFLAINIANVGRALPSLGVLSILLPIYGIGSTSVIIALIVLGVPPIMTNAYVAVDQVDSDTVDAAKGTGLRPLQVLVKVELPLALPLIFAGVRTALVFIVATATLAGFFGGGGLGDIISNPASYRISGVIGASYVMIVLAFASQLLLLGVEWLVTPAALRRYGTKRRSGRRAVTVSGAVVAEDEGVEEAGEVQEQVQLEQGSSAR